MGKFDSTSDHLADKPFVILTRYADLEDFIISFRTSAIEHFNFADTLRTDLSENEFLNDHWIFDKGHYDDPLDMENCVGWVRADFSLNGLDVSIET